jgi:phospholipid transport system substrate-binding protein
MVRAYPTAAPGIVAMLLLAGPGAWAAGPTDQLRDSFTEASRVFGQPESEEQAMERLGAVRQIVTRIFDFPEAAKLSLGQLWHSRTPAEQEEFVQLFTSLLDQTHLARIVAMARRGGDVRIDYVAEEIEGDYAIVYTTIATRTGRDMPLAYRMIRRGDRWAVLDVLIDGVSLAGNYHAQFKRVVQNSSYRELIARLQAKVPGVLGTSVAAAPAVSPPGTLPGAAAAERPSSAVVPKDALITTAALEVGAKGPVAEPGAVRGPAPTRPPAALAAVAKPEPGKSEPSGALRQASAKPYWVQVGAFRNPETAARVEARLREQGVPVSTHRGQTSDASLGVLSQVRVGPFPNRADATSMLRELQAQGHTPFITRDRD